MIVSTAGKINFSLNAEKAKAKPSAKSNPSLFHIANLYTTSDTGWPK